MPTSSRGHILGLDGLRAIAIAGIVLYHLMPQQVPGGYLGVTLFFTLMGYLILVKNPDAVQGKPFYAGTYYKKKFLRLYPPLLMVLVLSSLALLVLYPSYPRRILPEVLSVLFGFNNFWQIAQNASYFTRLANSSPFTHLWFLGLTFQYYLIWPLLLLLLNRLRPRIRKFGLRRVCFYFLILLSFLSMLEAGLLYRPDHDPSRIYYGTDTRAFSLFLGMAAAFLPVRKPRAYFKAHRAAGLAIAIPAAFGILTLSLTLDGSSAANYRGLMQLASLLFALLMLMVIWMPSPLGRLLDHPILRAVGQSSYLIYLLMYPVIFFVSHCSQDSSHPLWKVLCLALIAVLTVGLSFLDRKLSALPLSGGSRHLTRRRIYPAFLLVCLLLCALQWKISGRAIAAQAKDQTQMEEELKSQQQQQDQRNADAQGGSNQADASRNYSVTAIGDSVLLDASSTLSDQIPGIYVDGKVSRQAWAVKDLINSLKEKNLLGNIIILHLGTNGAFRQSVGQEIIDQLGSDRQIYWVTVYAPGVAWAAQSNATIKALADANSNVHLIDWANYAKGHRSWFFSDGIHLKPDGQKAYAELIRTSCGL